MIFFPVRFGFRTLKTETEPAKFGSIWFDNFGSVFFGFDSVWFSVWFSVFDFLNPPLVERVCVGQFCVLSWRFFPLPLPLYL